MVSTFTIRQHQLQVEWSDGIWEGLNIRRATPRDAIYVWFPHSRSDSTSSKWSGVM
ncbi:hypothetical protein AVEN_38670-1, partial [Araneus ventricosus]